MREKVSHDSNQCHFLRGNSEEYCDDWRKNSKIEDLSPHNLTCNELLARGGTGMGSPNY